MRLPYLRQSMSLIDCLFTYLVQTQVDKEREALGRTIGQDGFALLDAIYHPATSEGIKQVPAVEMLRQVWLQQFYHPA
jgi:hypothetical protein